VAVEFWRDNWITLQAVVLAVFYPAGTDKDFVWTVWTMIFIKLFLPDCSRGKDSLNQQFKSNSGKI